MIKFFRFFRSGCDDVQHVRLERTVESTIFEVVALFLIIATWIVAVLMYRHAPESIPTHFDIHGNPNNEGSRLVLLIMAGASTVVTLGTMACAYIPTYAVNLPFKMQNRRQYILASRMTRIISLLSGLMFLCVICMIGYPEAPIPRYLMFSFVALIIVVALIFTILMKRAAAQ